MSPGFSESPLVLLNCAQMNATLESAANLSTQLTSHGIEPLLYGSLGASIYLGAFKEFGDIDLLVEGVWLNEKWSDLLEIMRSMSFELVDLHEHEFRNSQDVSVAFADKGILARDGVVVSHYDVVTQPVGSLTITTLSPGAFKRAYEFSRQDGYRRDIRQKKDDAIIKLLDTYIAN